MFDIEDKPIIVSDLEFLTIDPLLKKNKRSYLIGSRSRNRVLCTKSEEVFQQVKSICPYLKGDYSLTDIIKISGYDKNTVEIIVNKLFNVGLLESYNENIDSELELVAKKLISIKLKKPTLKKIKISNYLVSIYPFMFSILIFFTLMIIVTKKINPFLIIYSGKEILCATIIMYCFSLLHEVGHMIVAWSEKIEIETINISLRWYVIPILYIKYKNVNFLQPRIKAKLLVGGLLMNLFSSLSLFILWSFFNYNIILLVALYNFNMFIASFYPQTLSDGYFLFLLLTDRSSIRLEAVKWIFSKKRCKPNKTTVIFISLYVLCTVGGLFTTYLIFGNTLVNLCNLYNINKNVIMIIYLVIYFLLISNMIIQAKKKLA